MTCFASLIAGQRVRPLLLLLLALLAPQVYAAPVPRPACWLSPIINAQKVSVTENAASNTVVGTVAASDPDAGQTLTDAITAGNTGGAFGINSSTGQLTVTTAGALNFAVIPSFDLTVQGTDNGSPASSASAFITVNLNDLPNAACLSSSTGQTTRGVLAGAVNQVILRIPVVLNTGVAEPLAAPPYVWHRASSPHSPTSTPLA